MVIPSKVFFILSLLSCIWIVNGGKLGDVHTSTAQLFELVKDEFRVVETLKSFIKDEETKLEVIKRYVEEWKETDPSKVVGNPLSSYHFLKRLSGQFNSVKNLLRNNASDKIFEELEEIHSGSNIPVESDVNGAAWALVRLQDVYNLTLDDLIYGSVAGSKSIKGLTAEDCLRFGEQSFTNLEFDLSDQWTEKAVKLMVKEQPNDPRIKDASDLRSKRKLMSGLLTTTLDIVQASKTDAFKRFSGLGIPTSFQRKIHSSPEDKEFLKNLEDVYKNLCQDISNENTEYHSGLTCSYFRGNSFYNLLMPFKMELIWHDPLMAVYHNILSDKETEMITTLALSRLHTTQVHSFTDHTPMKSLARVGKTAWVRKGDSGGVDKILQRIEHMTGLSTKSAEDFHVLNYGVGGHYDVHVDFFDLHGKQLDTEFQQGDRMATVLFYLNEVQAGGATVFPLLNIRVPAEKGSALVWLNLRRNGVGDYRTAHASCPVLLGQKWIANLWLHEYHQEFIWPCKLNDNE